MSAFPARLKPEEIDQEGTWQVGASKHSSRSGTRTASATIGDHVFNVVSDCGVVFLSEEPVRPWPQKRSIVSAAGLGQLCRSAGFTRLVEYCKRHLSTIGAAISAFAFFVAILAYAGAVSDEVMFPLDLASICLLVFGLDLPRMATGEILRPTQRLPFVVFAVACYVSFRPGASAHVPLAVSVALVCFVGSTILLNRSIDWPNVGSRLKKSLQAITATAERADPNFRKKRVFFLWGLISAKNTTFVTLSTLLLPLAASYLGLATLLAIISFLDQVIPTALLVTPVLFVWSLSKVFQSRRRARIRNPFRFITAAWEAKEDREDLLARSIVRSFLTPFGFLSFLVMCACVLLALVGLNVMWGFAIIGFQKLSPFMVAALLLLNMSFLPVLLFPGYLAFCLFLQTSTRKSLRVPAFSYAWLCYSLGVMAITLTPLSTSVTRTLTELQLQYHQLPGLSLLGALVLSANVARGTRPIKDFNRYALLAGLSPIVILSLSLASPALDAAFYAGLAAVSIVVTAITFLLPTPIGVHLNRRRKLGAVLFSVGFLVAAFYLVLAGMIALAVVVFACWPLTLYVFSGGGWFERAIKTVLGYSEEIIQV